MIINGDYTGLGGIVNGGPLGFYPGGGIDLSGVAFAVGFITGSVPYDWIENGVMTTILESGRPDKNGLSIAENVPSIINDILRSTSVYDNLIERSEDISVSPWIENDITVISPEEFSFDAAVSNLRQDISGQGFTTDVFTDVLMITDLTSEYKKYEVKKNQEGKQFTLSIYIKAGTTTNCQLHFYNRASGSLNILVRENGDYDNDTVFSRKFQTSQSSYSQDYVKTTTAAVAVPLDNSHDDAGTQKGNFFQGITANNPKLLTALTSEGELHIPKLSFGFNQGDIAGDVNIFDLNQDGLWLRYDDVTSELKLYDGTNTAVISHTAVVDEIISLRAVWSGSSMVLAIDETPGTVATFVGQFAIGSAPDDDNLAIGWNSELFRIHKDESGVSIIVYNELQNPGYL